MSTKGSVKPPSPLELVSVAGGLVQPLPCRRLPHDAPALGGAEGTSLGDGKVACKLAAWGAWAVLRAVVSRRVGPLLGLVSRRAASVLSLRAGGRHLRSRGGVEDGGVDTFAAPQGCRDKRSR